MGTPVTLKVYRGEALLRSERFTRDIIKIGRLSSAHLCLDDDKISRIHSVIEVSPEGGISIVDMGSAAGTFVNGRRVSKTALQDGDQIALGGLRLVLERDGAAPDTNRAVNAAVAVPAAAAADPAPAPTAPASAEKAPAKAAANAHGGQRVNGHAGATVQRTNGHLAADAAKIAATADAAAGLRRAATASVGAPAVTKGEAAQAPAAAAPSRRRAPAVDESDADAEAGADLGVELRLLWGDTLLDAGTFVKPAKPVLLGPTARCQLKVAAAGLPLEEFPVLRHDDGEYRAVFARGMTGTLVGKGAEPVSLAQLVKGGKATADGEIDGAYTVAVPRRGAVRLELGSGLALEARVKRPARVVAAPWHERINYQFLNLFLIVFFLQAGFMVAAETYPYETDTTADDLMKNPSRMANFIIKPPSEQPKKNPYLDQLKERIAKKNDPGEMAERHKGDEGQMGKKDAPKQNTRSAPKGDPNVKELVKHTGILAALKGKGGGGLSTIFGSGGLGGDIKGAVGNMFGPKVGDSFGFGGLGLKGTGTGGGGQGQTIGIGAVGTKGRGGGLGGYGTGVGGMGRKSDRDVSISAGTATVMGSLDRELVRKVIQDHAAQIRYCYEQQLALDPKLEGKVSLRWIINGDGRATNAQVDTTATTLLNAEIHRCMMARVQSWEFPKPKGGGVAVITYPWILRSSGGGD